MSGMNAFPSDGGVCEPELLRLMSRVQDANSRLLKLADHIEGVGNRLYGAMPQAPNSGTSPSAAPNGTVPMLNVVIDGLHSRISEVEDQFSRLGSL